jgi:glycosyltransferase involved in cell wall biosynthesis
MKAFTADDDVSLVIFAHVPAVPTDQYTEHIKKHIMSMFPGKDISKFPNLSIITSILPSSIVPLIYNSVNSFVLFSRGEGWGLPYCEAAASGLPIIGADHGGQKMFLDHENSLLVEPDLVSMCHPSLLYMTPFYKGMKFANYSEKATDDAAEKMRYAYENQDEMKIKADKCRDNLLEKFNWNKCARRVADRLKEI